MQRDEFLIKEAKRNFAAFVLAMHPDFKMGWFHLELCYVLTKFYLDTKKGLRPRVILNAPPRHGKSQLISRDFPAWILGIYSDANIISASYDMDLACSMSRDVQEIMKSDEYRQVFPNVNLLEKKSKVKKGVVAAQTAKYFEIPGRKGKYVAAGVGTGITGKGALFAIIDDPFKDRKEADSPTIRKNVWNWYTSTFRTRLAPGGGIIVMHTRWHEDDLVGRLLQQMNNGGKTRWTLINYSAIAEHDEPHRKAGEALHPERYNLDELEEIKDDIGSRDWEALYQGHPLPQTGGIFRLDWLKLYTPTQKPEHFDVIIQSWDLNVKKGEENDEAACVVLGMIGADIYLIDCNSKNRSFTETLSVFELISAKYPDALAKLVEDKGNGEPLNNTLHSKIPGIITIAPKGSKEQRAYAVAPFVEAGNFYVPDPRYCGWAQRYIDQLTHFPSVPHDDMVDATTQGLNYLIHNYTTNNLWS